MFKSQRKSKLISEIKACRVCEKELPHEPRPVVHFSSASQIIVIGQAPGVRVHNSGIPWNDPSGERLRSWLNVSIEQFYDNKIFGIIPMGFCYPGPGKSGDLPPRSECAPLWMDVVLSSIKKKQLTLLIGQYSQSYFLQEKRKKNLTETVKNWKEYLPEFFVLPHPSPRNNIWLKKNSWFETQTIPALRKQIKGIVK